MNNFDLINEVRSIVESACKNDDNIFGYGIWTHHIVSVVENSLILADKIGADKEIVELSALLHDYASIINKDFYEDHHIHSGIEAERLLKNFDYPQNKIDIIKKCIFEHRGSKVFEKSSKESVCLSSADAMAHIDNVPSLLNLAYVKKRMDIDEGTEWVKCKLKRSWNKLCSEAKEIIKNRYESALITLNKNNSL